MNNRLALVGLTIATVMAASPAVTSAQEGGTNPWRATGPQTGGTYAPTENNAAQAMQVPQFSQPKYAPLDGRLPDDKKNARTPYGAGVPGRAPLPPATPGGLYGPGVGGMGYGAPVYDGFGYPGMGYPGAGYGGYPGLGYSGLGYPGLGYPGGWGGLGPLSGWNTGYGGPLSWMPFW